ncbi:tetratricopeptide repeat protein [Cupriavidus basilensis]
MRSKSFYLKGAVLLAVASIPAMTLARDYRQPGTLGEGTQVHRFVLRDPATGQAMPGARYRLFLPGQRIAGVSPRSNEQDSVIFGVTDKQGNTVSVRMPRRHAKEKWILNPIVGEGDFGEAFSMRGESSNHPVTGMAYVLDLNGGYLFCNRTDSHGYTYYAQSHKAQTISLDYTFSGLQAGEYAWCRRESDAITALPAGAGPAAVFRQMLASYEAGRNEIGADFQARIRRKLIDLSIASRDDKRLDIALGLAPLPKDSLNEVGYALVDANWMVGRGMAMIDEALAHTPDNPYVLDSKGWALFRLGQPAQALTYLEQSLAAYGEGTESNLGARVEGLAHKGEVLMQLQRQDEARAAFVAAHELAPDDEKLLRTLARLEVALP